MDIKKTLFAALVAMVGVSANAQEETEYVFQPHWYIQAQIGGQETLGEISFSDLLSPNAQLAVGYQFNKVVGARFALNAWQSKAGSEKGLPKTYKWSWNYIAPKVDVSFDLTNLFCEYNPVRPVNVSVFAGIGVNVGFGNDDAWKLYKENTLAEDYVEANGLKVPEGSIAESQFLALAWEGSKARILGNAGVNVDFRINDNWKVGVELAATTTTDAYNSKRAGNSDWYFNALAGIKYTIGNAYTTRVKEKPVNPLEAELQNAKAEITRARAELVKAQETAQKLATQHQATNAKKEKAVEPLRRDVFFAISSTKITDAEMVKVMEIADYLNKNPKAKVSVTGYADKGTGNPRINMSLSQKRAAIVKETLIKKYGISADRISTDAKGDTEQPFTVEILNRVSICIAE